jgi:hypothetical protein
MSSTSTTGLVCPKCGGAFRAGFTRCVPCKVELVDRAAFEAGLIARDDPRQALAGKKTVTVVQASLPACREIERALLDAGIPAMVRTENEEGEALSAGTLKIGVVVAEDDLARVGVVMKARFEALIRAEGVGSFKTEAIDISAAEVECPACGHTGALKDGECADCGLFLGATD